MKTQEDRRRSVRVNLEHALIDIHTEKVQNHKEIRGKIFDISAVGVRLVSEEPYSVGSKIFLSLLLPNGVSLSDISCEVLRCRQRKDSHYSLAVEFKDLDYYQKSLVEDYIRLMKLRSEF